jgi:hypothetical protein
MSFDSMKEEPELQKGERIRVLAQLRNILKDLKDLEALHGEPVLLTRKDLLLQGLTEAAIDKIERLLSYFANPASAKRGAIIDSIENAEAAAVQQLADIVAKEKSGYR